MTQGLIAAHYVYRVYILAIDLNVFFHNHNVLSSTHSLGPSVSKVATSSPHHSSVVLSIMEVPAPAPAAWASSLATTILLATVALVLVTTTVLRRRGHRRQRQRHAPGPRPWPVIGNLNLLGALPHRSIHELSARYGPLMSLRFGSFPVVVGSSVEVAEVLLKTQDLAYLDRPRMACGKYTVYNYSGMLWSHYGPYWRQLRKLWVTELLSARQLRLTERVRAEEVRAMLRDLHPTTSTSTAATAVALKEHLLMVTLAQRDLAHGAGQEVRGRGRRRGRAGRRGGGGHDARGVQVDDRGDLLPERRAARGRHGAVAGLARRARVRGQDEAAGGEVRPVRRARAARARRAAAAGGRRVRAGGHGGPAAAARRRRRRRLGGGGPLLEVPLDRDGVKASVLELITGGTDTSSVTVEWAMSEALREPRVVGKVTEELDRVVGGRGRLVGEGDIPGLPYLGAVVKESMRLHPVVPLLIPRVGPRAHDGGRVRRPGGDARARQRLGHRPRPQRVGGPTPGSSGPSGSWPDGSKHSKVDVRGQDLELLPFGAGRRMCPAHGLGLRMVQLVLANLLHGFAWRLPGGMAPEELSMEEKFGITVSRMHQLQAIPDPRLPRHVYFEP